MRYLLTSDIRHPGKIEVEAATLDQALDRADDGDSEVSDEQGKPLVFDWGGIAEDDHGNDVSDQASIPAEPQREVWYAWKERREVDGRMRLLTPWSNPEQHEHPFDLLFDTPEAARVARGVRGRRRAVGAGAGDLRGHRRSRDAGRRLAA